MQKGIRQHIKGYLNKTLGFYIESLAGPCIGVLCAYYIYYHFCNYNFINTKDFTDRLITICTVLFGFLLTVLTLIVQGSNDLVAKMKKYGSYRRMVQFNKQIIFISALIVFISMFTNFFITDKQLDSRAAQITGSLNGGLFGWVIASTFLFVRIFYKFISYDSE